MPTCIHCKAEQESGEQYLTYGGVVWCNLDCIAENYVKRHERWEDPADSVSEGLYRLDDEKIEDIEKNHEWKTVGQ